MQNTMTSKYNDDAPVMVTKDGRCGIVEKIIPEWHLQTYRYVVRISDSKTGQDTHEHFLEGELSDPLTRLPKEEPVKSVSWQTRLRTLIRKGIELSRERLSLSI